MALVAGRTDFTLGSDEEGGRQRGQVAESGGLEPSPPWVGSPCGRFMVWAGGTRLDALFRSFYVCPAEILLTSHPQVSGLMA